MASVKWIGKADNTEVGPVVRTYIREREIRFDAFLELVRWFTYSFLFSLLPFLINVLVIVFRDRPHPQITIGAVFQIPGLIFVGIFVCGTILERLSEFKPKRKSHKLFSGLGTFLYLVVALLLSVSYALCRDTAVGGGGAYDRLILVGSISVICIIAAISALVYWLVHVHDFCRRRVAAISDS